MDNTYLVTGAAGFIGSRFVESCSARGISVVSVDQKSHFETRDQNSGLNFGKIIDRDDFFTQSLNLPWVDAVVHLGAVTDTRETNLAKLDLLNFQFSKQLWNWAAGRGIPFVYASSAATYGSGISGNCGVDYDDDERWIPQLRPLNAYGESKQKFDLWALENEKSGICPPAWSGFKFFNVYGFGESHKRFMSSVVLHSYDQIRSKGFVTLFKSHREGVPDGFQRRDFVSVEDVVEVLHFAMEKPIRRGIYNLGTGQARTFLDLARAVFRSLGKEEKVQFVDTPLSVRNQYQYFTQARMDRLKDQGYGKSFLSLEEGVSRYIQRLGL